MLNWCMGTLVHYQESRVCMGVAVCLFYFIWLIYFFKNLHAKALLKVLVYMILWFDHNVMYVVNVNLFI